MTRDEKMKAGVPLVKQAIEAMHRYHEARDLPASAEEVERLRREAEWLFESVGEYQRRVLGDDSDMLH